MIRSTFAGFISAQLAMSASQRALDVTGQNMANVNTPGYTRQRLDLSSINPVGASLGSSPFDCRVGQGVMMTGISQIRDPFLDIQYRNQIVKVGTADAMDQVLSEIGNIFDETDKAAVGAALDDLISQLKKMSSTQNTDSSSTEAMVRSACEVLINAIHQNATSLKQVENGLVTKFKEQLIPNINECLKEIVNLNKSIKNSQVLGNPALELKDKRNQLIDDLATYLPIDVSYKKETLGGGITVETLHISFTDTNGNKYNLIDDSEGGSFNLTDTNGGLPLSLTITDTAGVEGGDISDLLKDGVLKGNFDMLNKSEIFDGTDVKGIGYYQKMFDTFVNTFAKKLNELNSETDAAGNVIEHPLFETSDGSTEFTAANIKISDAWKSGAVTVTRKKNDGPGGTDNSTEYDNVQKIIDAISADKTTEFIYTAMVPQIGADGNPVLGPDGNPVLVPRQIEAFKGTFQECYNNIQGTQAIERKATTSILKNQVSVLNEIANSKDSVSGVYMDEETSNIMRYQQSYNAAARLMTAMDEALNTLINNTGVVGR